jgi:hypothetical protein
MSILSEFGWLVVVGLFLVGADLFARRFHGYYQAPDEADPLLGRHHVPDQPEDAVPDGWAADAQDPSGERA